MTRKTQEPRRLKTEKRTLDGIRVVSLAVNIPGPAAAAMMRQLGAAVTKVEPPAGDPLQIMCPRWYRELRKRQRVLQLDLKTRRGRARLSQLLQNADILLTSHRPSSLDRLGLDCEQLRKQYPRLCHVAIVGYPHPRDEVPGHDLTYQATVGLVNPPQMPATLLADLAAAERALAAALALLLSRERFGGGGFTNIAIAQAAYDFAAPLRYRLTRSGNLLGGGAARYRIYKTKRGWVALAALENRFWEKLLRELELKDATSRRLARLFMKRTATEWEDWAHQRDLPLIAVRTVR
jgi:crotonobetainyl-CoA:carnitine CoA-transferase CaiB-like acyl-CoA transferase